jgi:hypothetical protein
LLLAACAPPPKSDEVAAGLGAEASAGLLIEEKRLPAGAGAVEAFAPDDAGAVVIVAEAGLAPNKEEAAVEPLEAGAWDVA